MLNSNELSPSPQTLKEGVEETLPKMEELGRHETFRREIARKLF